LKIAFSEADLLTESHLKMDTFLEVDFLNGTTPENGFSAMVMEL